MRKSWERMDWTDWALLVGLWVAIAWYNHESLYRIYDSLTAAGPTVERQLMAEETKSRLLEQELKYHMENDKLSPM